MMNELNNMRGEDKKKLGNLDNPLNPMNQGDTLTKPGAKKPNKVATPNAVHQKTKAPNIMDKIKKALPVDVSSMVDAIKKQLVGSDPTSAAPTTRAPNSGVRVV